jgi:hypothetical protein
MEMNVGNKSNRGPLDECGGDLRAVRQEWTRLEMNMLPHIGDKMRRVD